MSCQHAASSLLPKKGGILLLKNWRPAAPLNTDDEIISKCLSNRFKHHLHHEVYKDPTYCIPGDNLFLTHDILDLCSGSDIAVELIKKKLLTVLIIIMSSMQ